MVSIIRTFSEHYPLDPIPGSSPGGVTDDFFFLSYLACKF